MTCEQKSASRILLNLRTNFLPGPDKKRNHLDSTVLRLISLFIRPSERRLSTIGPRSMDSIQTSQIFRIAKQLSILPSTYKLSYPTIRKDRWCISYASRSHLIGFQTTLGLQVTTFDRMQIEQCVHFDKHGTQRGQVFDLFIASFQSQIFRWKLSIGKEVRSNFRSKYLL